MSKKNGIAKNLNRDLEADLTPEELAIMDAQAAASENKIEEVQYLADDDAAAIANGTSDVHKAMLADLDSRGKNLNRAKTGDEEQRTMVRIVNIVGNMKWDSKDPAIRKVYFPEGRHLLAYRDTSKNKVTETLFSVPNWLFNDYFDEADTAQNKKFWAYFNPNKPNKCAYSARLKAKTIGDVIEFANGVLDNAITDFAEAVNKGAEYGDEVTKLCIFSGKTRAQILTLLTLSGISASHERMGA